MVSDDNLWFMINDCQWSIIKLLFVIHHLWFLILLHSLWFVKLWFMIPDLCFLTMNLNCWFRWFMIILLYIMIWLWYDSIHDFWFIESPTKVEIKVWKFSRISGVSGNTFSGHIWSLRRDNLRRNYTFSQNLAILGAEIWQLSSKFPILEPPGFSRFRLWISNIIHLELDCSDCWNAWAPTCSICAKQPPVGFARIDLRWHWIDPTLSHMASQSQTPPKCWMCRRSIAPVGTFLLIFSELPPHPWPSWIPNCLDHLRHRLQQQRNHPLLQHQVGFASHLLYKSTVSSKTSDHHSLDVATHPQWEAQSKWSSPQTARLLGQFLEVAMLANPCSSAPPAPQ